MVPEIFSQPVIFPALPTKWEERDINIASAKPRRLEPVLSSIGKAARGALDPENLAALRVEKRERAPPPSQMAPPPIQPASSYLPSSPKSLEALEKEEDWKARIEERSTRLCERLKRFALFCYMGFQILDPSYQVTGADLMQLSTQAVNNPLSPFALFTQKYRLRWVQLAWWRCALFYCTAWLTSFIPNIVETAKELLYNLHTALSKEDRTTLQQVVGDTLDLFVYYFTKLKEGSEEYADPQNPFIKATDAQQVCLLKRFDPKQPSYQELDHETIPHYKKKVIDSLKQDFVDAVLKHAPPVQFFKGAKSLPWIGLLFYLPPFSWIERGLNGIISFSLRKWVLPTATGNIVQGIFSTIASVNYVFSYSLKTLLIDQMGRLQKTIDKPGDTPLPTLSEEVRNSVHELRQLLFKRLDYSGLDGETRENVAKGIQASKTKVSDPVEGELEEGVEHGLKLLTAFLSDRKNIDLFFASALNLANVPFEQGEVPENIQELDQRKETELNTLGTSLIETIVSAKVKEKIQGIPPSSREEAEHEAWSKILTSLKATGDNVEKFIKELSKAVSPQQGGLFQDLQELQQLATDALFDLHACALEGERALSGPPLLATERQGFERHLTPLYDQFPPLIEGLTAFRKMIGLYDQHAQLVSVYTELESVVLKGPPPSLEARKAALEKALRRLQLLLEPTAHELAPDSRLWQAFHATELEISAKRCLDASRNLKTALYLFVSKRNNLSQNELVQLLAPLRHELHRYPLKGKGIEPFLDRIQHLLLPPHREAMKGRWRELGEAFIDLDRALKQAQREGAQKYADADLQEVVEASLQEDPQLNGYVGKERETLKLTKQLLGQLVEQAGNLKREVEQVKRRVSHSVTAPDGSSTVRYFEKRVRLSPNAGGYLMQVVGSLPLLQGVGAAAIHSANSVAEDPSILADPGKEPPFWRWLKIKAALGAVVSGAIWGGAAYVASPYLLAGAAAGSLGLGWYQKRKAKKWLEQAPETLVNVGKEMVTPPALKLLKELYPLVRDPRFYETFAYGFLHYVGKRA